MNKQENRLTVSILATLTTGIALVYTLILYHQILFAVVGMSVLFLITTYILIQNILAYNSMKNKSLSVQVKDSIDDISAQLETMSGAQSQIGKATFLYTRKAAESVATLEQHYSESQEALYRSLSALSQKQNKAVKLSVKYDQINTNKLISAIHDLRGQLSSTMVNGFDEINPDNETIVALLQDIVTYLKNQPQTDSALTGQLTGMAQELESISNQLAHLQFTTPAVTETVTKATLDSAIRNAAQATGSMTEQLQELEAELQSPAERTPVVDEIAEDDTATTIVAQVTDIPESVSETDTTVISESVPESEPTAVSETVPESEPAAVFEFVPESEPAVVSESVPESEPAVVSESVPESESTPSAPILSDDPNKQLSPDEIAALFAAAEPAPRPHLVTEDEEKPFKPTFTVVGKSHPEEPAVEKEPVPTIGDLTEDPNRQLSPDEIAALFAAAEPAPKKEERQPEPVATAPAEDPNRQLSPDEIAALFAAAEPTPKKEEETASMPPVTDDPNHQLTPEEIAALFSSLG